MKLDKQLISFYKKSKELELAKVKVKELKKTVVKLSKGKKHNLSEIQYAIDNYLEMSDISEQIFKLPSRLLGIQRKIVTALKAVGLPAKQSILIENEQFGIIEFWYEGTKISFREVQP